MSHLGGSRHHHEIKAAQHIQRARTQMFRALDTKICRIQYVYLRAAEHELAKSSAHLMEIGAAMGKGRHKRLWQAFNKTYERLRDTGLGFEQHCLVERMRER